jgi:lipoate-protein ligase A
VDVGEDLLLFYINGPSIIIGRNQNTLEEINLPYVQEHGVHVVRRLSGGGAVYHDLGNLNFSFITDYAANYFQNFHKFTQPVIKVLHALGVDAALSGRNDILVDGRKISGNAQYRTATRMFSHGTLLFDSRLEDVVAALNVSESKITSKGLKSVRSRVANIIEFLEEEMDVLGFRQRLLKGIFEGEVEIPTYDLTEEDWDSIRSISVRRYANWDWNFGKSPEFNVRNSKRFAGGEVDICLDVRQGRIQNVRIYGDFLGEGEVSELEERLQGVPYARESVVEALEDVDLQHYFGNVDREEFVRLLY